MGSNEAKRAKFGVLGISLLVRTTLIKSEERMRSVRESIICMTI